jgi:hypothetical protein
MKNFLKLNGPCNTCDGKGVVPTGLLSKKEKCCDVCYGFGVYGFDFGEYWESHVSNNINFRNMKFTCIIDRVMVGVYTIPVVGTVLYKHLKGNKIHYSTVRPKCASVIYEPMIIVDEECEFFYVMPLDIVYDKLKMIAPAPPPLAPPPPPPVLPTWVKKLLSESRKKNKLYNKRKIQLE